MNNKLLAVSGELQARRYLKGLGYKILETNAKNKLAEVDIIALDGNTLVFVEVKARETDEYGKGYEAVDRRRQMRYIRFAKGYMVNTKYIGMNARFDVISIDDGELIHIENAYSL